MTLPTATHAGWEEAQAYVREEAWDEAFDALLRLLEEVHHGEEVYDDWVRTMANVALRKGDPAAAGLCLEYRLQFDRARLAYEQGRRFAAAARCLERGGDHAAAAGAYESIGAHARAAMAWESAGQLGLAIRAWERAAQRYSEQGKDYERALCLLNLGLAQLDTGDKKGRSTLSRAIVLLEEEADRAETQKDVTRALACYHALIHLGRKTATHENLAEGYLNCVRLMEARDHRFFALQYYHDFAEASLLVGEHQAAAEVLREAAEFCRRRGMLYTNDFLARSAKAFEAAAEQHLSVGAAPELAENALLAALDCHNRRGDMARVQATYARLAELPLAEARTRRYARLAEQVEIPVGRTPEGWSFRGYFAEATAYPRIWRTDAAEQDLEADPLSPLQEAMGNLDYWDVVRRRCLLVCLKYPSAGLDAEPLERRIDLVRELGRIGSPVALRPLRHLYRDPASPAAVRAAVAASLRLLPFRESLELCGEAFADPDESVREAVLGALRYLVFPGALIPLMKLFREHPDIEMRREVVLALGRLVGMEQKASKDALDFLLYTWREQVDPLLEDDLRIAVGTNVTPKTLPVLERHLLAETDAERKRILQKIVARVEARRYSGSLMG